MESIAHWWSSLSAVNQWFYCAAGFFSLFFLWQFISAVIGLSAEHAVDHDVTSSVDTRADHGAGDTTAEHDAAATVDVFRLVSFRSVLAFFTMFTWAGALYMNDGKEMGLSLFYALLWGLAGMVVMAFLMRAIWKMAETGNISLATCVGQGGTVYLNIPADGAGEVRVSVSGVVRVVRAKTTGSRELKSGTAIRVSRVLGQNLVEVEPA
jgi:hypothetical protein